MAAFIFSFKRICLENFEVFDMLLRSPPTRVSQELSTNKIEELVCTLSQEKNATKPIIFWGGKATIGTAILSFAEKSH
jgi:hypothetical protein